MSDTGNILNEFESTNYPPRQHVQHHHLHDHVVQPVLHLPPQQPIGGRQKRLRTSFKHHQLRIMKTYFQLNHNPDAKDLKQLAQKTGLGKRILQVWFQNARAKYRRSIARQEMESRSVAGSGAMSSTVSPISGGVIDDHQLALRHAHFRNTHQSAIVAESGDRHGGGSGLPGPACSQMMTECGGDLLDQTTATNSVGSSSMSEFLNSSLSDDVM